MLTSDDLLWMDHDRSHDEVDRWGIPATEDRYTMCLSDRLAMAKDHFDRLLAATNNARREAGS